MTSSIRLSNQKHMHSSPASTAQSQRTQPPPRHADFIIRNNRRKNCNPSNDAEALSDLAIDLTSTDTSDYNPRVKTTENPGRLESSALNRSDIGQKRTGSHLSHPSVAPTLKKMKNESGAGWPSPLLANMSRWSPRMAPQRPKPSKPRPFKPGQGPPSSAHSIIRPQNKLSSPLPTPKPHDLGKKTGPFNDSDSDDEMEDAPVVNTSPASPDPRQDFKAGTETAQSNLQQKCEQDERERQKREHQRLREAKLKQGGGARAVIDLTDDPDETSTTGWSFTQRVSGIDGDFMQTVPVARAAPRTLSNESGPGMKYPDRAGLPGHAAVARANGLSTAVQKIADLGRFPDNVSLAKAAPVGALDHIRALGTSNPKYPSQQISASQRVTANLPLSTSTRTGATYLLPNPQLGGLPSSGQKSGTMNGQPPGRISSTKGAARQHWPKPAATQGIRTQIPELTSRKEDSVANWMKNAKTDSSNSEQDDSKTHPPDLDGMDSTCGSIGAPTRFYTTAPHVCPVTAKTTVPAPSTPFQQILGHVATQSLSTNFVTSEPLRSEDVSDAKPKIDSNPTQSPSNLSREEDAKKKLVKLLSTMRKDHSTSPARRGTDDVKAEQERRIKEQDKDAHVKLVYEAEMLAKEQAKEQERVEAQKRNEEQQLAQKEKRRVETQRLEQHRLQESQRGADEARRLADEEQRLAYEERRHFVEQQHLTDQAKASDAYKLARGRNPDNLSPCELALIQRDAQAAAPRTQIGLALPQMFPQRAVATAPNTKPQISDPRLRPKSESDIVVGEDEVLERVIYEEAQRNVLARQKAMENDAGPSSYAPRFPDLSSKTLDGQALMQRKTGGDVAPPHNPFAAATKSAPKPPAPPRKTNKTYGLGEVRVEDCKLLKWRDAGMGWPDILDMWKDFTGVSRSQGTLRTRYRYIKAAVDRHGVHADTVLRAALGGDPDAVLELNKAIYGEDWVPGKLYDPLKDVGLPSIKLNAEDLAIWKMKREGWTWAEIVTQHEQDAGLRQGEDALRMRWRQVEKIIKQDNLDSYHLSRLEDHQALQVLNRKLCEGGLEPSSSSSTRDHATPAPKSTVARFQLSHSQSTRRTDDGHQSRAQSISFGSTEEEDQVFDPARIRDNLRQYHQMHERPTIAGKIMHEAAFQHYLELIRADEENNDSETDTEIDENPITEQDRIQFVFQVQRRAISREEEKEENIHIYDKPWLDCGEAFEKLGEANVAVNREALHISSNRQRVADPGGNWSMHNETDPDDGTLVVSVTNDKTGTVQARVLRRTRDASIRSLPTSSDHLAPRKVYLVKNRLATRTIGDDMFEEDSTTTETATLDNTMYTTLDLANKRAIERYVEITFFSSSRNLNERDLQEEQMRQGYWDELANADGEGDAFFCKEASDEENELVIWVEEGRLEGPRNL